MSTSFWIALIFIASSCGYSAIDWRNHVPFRATKTGLTPAVAERGDQDDTRIRAGKDRVAIAIDAVFLRDLPLPRGAHVAFGISISGLREKGKEIATVLDLKKGAGPNAFLWFHNVLVIEPFEWSGDNVTIRLHFQPISDRVVPAIRATLEEIQRHCRPPPRGPAEIEKDSKFFGELMNLRAPAGWTYTMTFFSSDRHYRDKPDLLLSAGRFLLVMIPRAESARAVREKLARSLRLRGVSLVDNVRGEEYMETPYVVINITRVPKS